MHLHYDVYVPMWVKLSEQYKFELIVTSHHSYADNVHRETPNYRKIFNSCLQAKKQLVLSPRIKSIFEQARYAGKISVLPNGVDIARMAFSNQPGNGKAICLGRIQPRKRQAGLSVVVTPQASANLDSSLPFIYVRKFSTDFIKTATQACRDNFKYRSQIRQYAEQHFDWKMIAKRYVRILERWNDL